MTAIVLSQAEKDPFKIVTAVNQLAQGRSNAVGEVTLRTNQTTTVVPAPTCAAGCHVSLSPRTANAAAAMATTFILKVNVKKEQFTITHASNGQNDRTFSWFAVG